MTTDDKIRHEKLQYDINRELWVQVPLQSLTDTIFMNLKNDKTWDPRRLFLNISDKINLKNSGKCVALSNLSIYYTWKNIKCHTKTINLKYQLRHGVKSFSYLVHNILSETLKIILNIC